MTHRKRHIRMRIISPVLLSGQDLRAFHTQNRIVICKTLPGWHSKRVKHERKKKKMAYMKII